MQDAVSRDRKLAIDYRRPDGQLANRTIDPLGIVAKGMTWYLVANTPAGFRTFRVSRIESATVLEVAVERPRGFDLATHWKSSTEKRVGGPCEASALAEGRVVEVVGLDREAGGDVITDQAEPAALLARPARKGRCLHFTPLRNSVKFAA